MKKLIYIIVTALCITAGLADVPAPQTHQPVLSNYMQRIYFQTVMLSVFGPDISGMVPDKYSDLNWHPAFILAAQEDGLYLDFNYAKPVNSYNTYYYNPSGDFVIPNWFSNTRINTPQQDPLYNFAWAQKLNDKLAIAVINRTVFDYGPFRSASAWQNYSAGYEDISYNRSAYNELDNKTVEMATNQQTVWGVQTELSLGYRLNQQLDLGLRAGHYIMRRWGDLYDARYSKYPHSFIDDINDEEFRIHGDQMELGAGLLYHPNDKTDIGLYISVLSGTSSEKNAVTDFADHWSEQETDSNYYSIRTYDMRGNHNYSDEGISPYITLVFQKKLSPEFTLRSFLSYNRTKNEIDGSLFSRDTTYSDRTYDRWDYVSDQYYFTRDEGFQGAESEYAGSGSVESTTYNWFASLIYNPDQRWSAFAALRIGRQDYERTSDDHATYYRGSFNQRYYFDARTWGSYDAYDRDYHYRYEFTNWTFKIPVGVQARIIDGFSLLLGAHMRFDLSEVKEYGEMLYTQTTHRTTRNGIVEVEDIQINRPENYTSHMPKEFNKQSDFNFGAMYEHDSGLRLFVQSGGNITDKSSWNFGVEYVF